MHEDGDVFFQHIHELTEMSAAACAILARSLHC
jgi:hypothetical protein